MPPARISQGVPPTDTGAPAFNQNFDLVFRSIGDRLHCFNSVDACGRWNSVLIDDFKSDDSFVRTTDDLFAEAVARHTNGECVTSDGIGLESVTVDFGKSMKLHFRLPFLDAPDGFWETPGQFSIVPDPTNIDLQLATLSCGVREPDGDFWYLSSNRRRSVVLPDDYDWAYSRTRVYSSQSISTWMKPPRIEER